MPGSNESWGSLLLKTVTHGGFIGGVYAVGAFFYYQRKGLGEDWNVSV
jgi:hypothetical protein